MFGIFNPKKADVLGHWYALVPNFNTSSDEFYKSIQKELEDRKVPGLKLSHEEFAEGGVLSHNRVYLRMTRERLVFDVCAATFGTSFFFSCRFAELPLHTKISQLLLTLFVFVSAVWAFWHFLGFWNGSFALLLCAAALIYLLRNAVAMGLRDLDYMLMSSVFGSIYEAWFRAETYYRQDTRLMYCDTVNAVVKAKVEEVTGANGVKLLRYNEHNPVLSELYKPTTVSLEKS